MPRIRTIKPEFWDDEKLGNLSLQANLLYIGMWNFADDEGIIRSGPAWLKAKIFPHREELRVSDVKTWVNELQGAEMLIPFSYNNEGYYWIRTFKAHQKIDRPQKSKIPQELLSSIIRNNSSNTRRIRDEHSTQEWNGMEEERKGEDNAREFDEKVNEAHEKTCKAFSVTESGNTRMFMDLRSALQIIAKGGRIEYYIKQLTFYFPYKDKQESKTCGIRSWIWGDTHQIDSGHWCRMDYEEAYKKLNPTPVSTTRQFKPLR